MGSVLSASLDAEVQWKSFIRVLLIASRSAKPEKSDAFLDFTDAPDVRVSVSLLNFVCVCFF